MISVFKLTDSLLIVGTSEEKQLDEENCYYISQDLERLRYYLYDCEKQKVLKHLDKLNDSNL